RARVQGTRRRDRRHRHAAALRAGDRRPHGRGRPARHPEFRAAQAFRARHGRAAQRQHGDRAGEPVVRARPGLDLTPTDGPAPPDLALAFVTLIWGSTFLTVKHALLDVAPMRFLLLRFTIASVVLLAACAVTRTRIDRRAWRAGFVAGVPFFLSFLTQTFGLVW